MHPVSSIQEETSAVQGWEGERERERISGGDQRKANRCSAGLTGSTTLPFWTRHYHWLPFPSPSPSLCSTSIIYQSHTHRHSVAHLKLVSASSEFVSVHWVIIEHGRRSRSLSQLVAAVAFRENQIKLTVDGNIQTHTNRALCSPANWLQSTPIVSVCLCVWVCVCSVHCLRVLCCDMRENDELSP